MKRTLNATTNLSRASVPLVTPHAKPASRRTPSQKPYGPERELLGSSSSKKIPKLSTTAPTPKPERRPSQSSPVSYGGASSQANVGYQPPQFSPSARARFDGTDPEPLTGAAPLLGRYRVMDLRDVGGFGSVFVCWDVRLQRRVAVKCLPLEIGTAAVTLEEALAEARASSFLTHPNIVTVHDFEVDDSYAYLVMEYVDGVTLAELIQRVEGGSLVFDEVAYLVQCLASALEFAHRHGVLHLDIKPQNVLIDRSGQIKLGDFGMASLASAAGWGGARGGTVGYMAPEQLKGEIVDERSDVFSFAVVIYEALCGTSPFMAPTAKDSLALIEAGAPPIGERERELSPLVAHAIMEALAPQAVSREASVERLAQTLLTGSRAPSSRAGQRYDPSSSFEDDLPGEPLGDPARGLASLKRLMSQTQNDEPVFDETPWKSLDPPARRLPRLASLCARAANAIATLGFLLLAIHLLNGYTAQIALIIAPHAEVLPGFAGISWPWWLLVAIASTLAALWAPVGSAFALAIGSATTFFGCIASADAFNASVIARLVVPALIFSAGSFGWWFWVGRRTRAQSLSTAALLVPATFLSPGLAPNLAGYGLRPLQAALTGAASCALATVFCATSRGASSPWLNVLLRSEFVSLPSDLPLSDLMISAFTSPAVWALIGASALGAFFAALLSRAALRRLWQGRAGARIICGLGQTAATACAISGCVLGKGLENGGTYAPPTPVALGILLGSLALMLIITALFGPSQLSETGETSWDSPSRTQKAAP